MSRLTSSPDARLYRRLLGYLRPYTATFLFALAAMAVYGATDGFVPYLLKRILDDVFGSQNLHMLYVLIGVIFTFALVRGIFGFLQKYLTAKVGLDIVRDLRNEISAKLLSLSPSFFLAQSTGGIISRVTNDTLLVRTALTEAAAALLRDSIRVVALTVAALYLDPVLALIALIGFPLGLWPVLRYGRKVRRLSRVGQNQFGGLTGLLQETIVGHSIVQSFTREGYEQRRFAEENERFTSTFRRAEKYGALAGPTNELIASLAIGAVLLYGGMSVIEGTRTQGDFIAFITALFLLYEPLKKLSRVNTLLQTGAAAAERIFEVLDVEPDVREAPNAEELSGVIDSVEFETVFFRYNKDSEPAEEGRQWSVEDISLKVRSGETLAIVGRSGSGKSTLIKLLPRFFDIDAGRLLINGRDVREFSLQSLRRQIAVVQQSTFLFNDTVYHNIAYGLESAGEEDVRRAAAAANADAFIRRLPKGYETVIGEQGFSLSGGERARLSIARALLKNSPILVLDEATANLDSESEELVQDAIDRLMAGRTVFVIAHRLATVRAADRIAVLREGQLAELGTHDELLAADGEYARLYRMQFRGDSAPAEQSSQQAAG